MPTPIYNALKKYSDSNIYPFHMPGHKQGRGLNINDIIKMDITEIDGLDNLHNPNGVILESQMLTAKVFGADETFFLVNGSSAGIISAINASCNPAEKILVSRNCHKSVYSGIIFSGAVPIYIMPEIIKPYSLLGGINPNKIDDIMSNNDIKAVILTNPTYEGFCSDIKSIANIVHKNNALLIVDEAHGAHFKFNKSFPKTALEQGADIVIQSIHKTLPSLTQTALLHIKGKRVNREKLKQMLSMFQTSSPSYIFMCSIDICREQILKYDFDKFLTMINTFRNNLKYNKSLKLIGNELNGKFAISEIDISKIVIYCCNKYINGNKLYDILLNNYKLQMEMKGINYILAITTIADEREGVDRFYKALYEIEKDLEYFEPKYFSIFYNEPKIVVSPRDAMLGYKIEIPLDKSIGKISGDFLIPYPPGIPILVPGEEITSEIIKTIYEYRENNISILGLKYYNELNIEIMEG